MVELGRLRVDWGFRGMRVANGLRWARAVLPDSVSLGVNVLYSLFVMCVVSNRRRSRCHDGLGRLVVRRLGRWLICTCHSARSTFVSGFGVRMSGDRRD